MNHKIVLKIILGCCKFLQEEYFINVSLKMHNQIGIYFTFLTYRGS